MNGGLKAVVAAVVISCGCASALVVGYHVEPVCASQSGWTRKIPGKDSVAQVITMNFDELDSTTGSYVEFFAGTKAGGGQYNLSVLTYPGGSQIAYPAYANGNVDHKWVRFYLHVTRPDSIVKGKKLEFRFTRGNTVPGDSFQFYYDSVCGYNYGFMIAPTLQSIPVTAGLAMRCYGRMNPVSDVWRGCTNHWTDPAPETCGIAALAKAGSIGIRWIREDFGHWMTWYGWPTAVMDAYDRYVSDSFNLMGVLCFGRGDTAAATAPPESSTSPNLFLYPPRNLWPDSGQTNYWAQYCRSIMESMPAVKYWEIWPEANAPWYWRDPDTHYYKGALSAQSTTAGLTRGESDAACTCACAASPKA
jgi:hypothetical protein